MFRKNHIHGSVQRRSRKEAERWIREYRHQRRLHRELHLAAGDILSSGNFRKTKAHIQHGSMTVNSHCINVAKCSLAISDALKISCNRREMIRGALLHDYFLYDWHDDEHCQLYRLHGFRHPGVALRNAIAEYELTPRERDIIGKHMWPLTVKPPLCREAWIVTVADKWCSILETLHIQKGHGAHLLPENTRQAAQK